MSTTVILSALGLILSFQSAPPEPATATPVLDNNTPGMGTFFVRDAHFKGRNLEMLWRTLPPK